MKRISISGLSQTWNARFRIPNPWARPGKRRGGSSTIMTSKKLDIFSGLTIFSSVLIMGYILLPLVQMFAQPSLSSLTETLMDSDVRKAISLSLVTSCTAAVLCLVFGTPFAWLLARKEFPGKKIVESIIDLPIMIPHPIVGIAILGLAGRNHWLGRMLMDAGIRIMGTPTGIIVVLVFVGIPFYVNAVKNGFESVSPRLENAARTMGATSGQAFMRVTMPLALRSMFTGLIMCIARAISEFGAVIIVAYHPMTAPVLIYERFTAYGLKYSQPVAVWLILVSLLLFLILRLVSATPGGSNDRN